MPVVRCLYVPRRRRRHRRVYTECPLFAFNYIIYPIFVQCINVLMGRFGHENGPFWMLAGLGRFGLVFSSIGAVLVGAVLVCVGRFQPSLGPF